MAGAGHGQLGCVGHPLHLVRDDGVAGGVSAGVAAYRVDTTGGGSLGATDPQLFPPAVSIQKRRGDRQDQEEGKQNCVDRSLYQKGAKGQYSEQNDGGNLEELGGPGVLSRLLPFGCICNGGARGLGIVFHITPSSRNRTFRQTLLRLDTPTAGRPPSR